MNQTLEEVEELTGTTAACQLLGLSRAGVYRARSPRVHGPARKPGGGTQPAALSPQEIQEVLDVLTSDRFADKAPEQVWAILLDEGTYLCSTSTMYRLLRAQDQVRERRAQASHPPRKIPELHATGPNQCWSWDITKLRGPVKGIWYCAYVMIDIFSRKVIHAEVHPYERELLARDFITAAVAANGGVLPGYVHSDNGSPMIGKTVTQLLSDLHITASLSRPHVSNDNPYSEAWNKTLKYAPVFPERFGSLIEARDFLARFVHYYNHQHRHSEIGLHTPASVHDGTWKSIRKHRQSVLDHAWQAHPERFRKHRPTAPKPPKEAWINRPTITTEIHTARSA
jgi:transposase InsO family protein